MLQGVLLMWITTLLRGQYLLDNSRAPLLSVSVSNYLRIKLTTKGTRRGGTLMTQHKHTFNSLRVNASRPSSGTCQSGCSIASGEVSSTVQIIWTAKNIALAVRKEGRDTGSIFKN